MVLKDDGTSTFLSVRARLFRIAHRTLGCAAAAKDIVHEVWIRWQSTNRCAVRNPTAFPTTMANRLAINLRQAAHSRREVGATPGLDEPVDTDSDQSLRAERADALTLGVFVLLGRLSSAERAAYILREAFDYAYGDIARVLGVQEANARQLLSRARLHLTQGPRTSVLAEDHRQLLAALTAAAEAVDARGAIDLFAADARRHERRREDRLASSSSQISRHGGGTAAGGSCHKLELPPVLASRAGDAQCCGDARTVPHESRHWPNRAT
jgi:RNA polymerase sigma-70 factor, ECF subfamily